MGHNDRNSQYTFHNSQIYQIFCTVDVLWTSLDIFGHLWTSLDIFGHLTLQICKNVLVFLGDFEGIPWHPKKTSLAGNCGTTGTQTAYR